nr:uncharacterized protein LOC104111715 [Nicotiana tomentosiformis]
MIKGVDIDKYSQQPWKPSAAPLLIAKKFKMPDIPKYDGTTNPRDHITAFTTSLKGNNLTKQEIESVLVKRFGETLKKGVLTWYSLLPENSIDSFAVLTNSFIKAHSGAQKVEKRMEDIFKWERMMLPRVPDNWAAMAFASNLKEKISKAMRRLKECLREFLATTWNDMSNRYSAKLRIEEDMVAQLRANERAGSRRSEFRKEWDARGNNSNTHARIGDCKFNVSTSELVAILRRMGDKVWWPKEMRSNPSKRKPDFLCEFHNDHGHRTTDCRLLQGEVEHLLKQGYLTDLFIEKGRQSYMKNRQEPPKPPSPKRTVNVITWGDEVNGVTYIVAKKMSKVTNSREASSPGLGWR